jgi:crotonobetainyl-CoA:carnitine CoA-transferase CaiB-like acyl-CoA transferase
VVDVNLLESMLQLMGPLPSLYALTGEQQPRLGGGLPYTVPRGAYRCADGRWIAVSTSSDGVAARVMALLGVGDDERFATFAGRAAHRDELEALMTAWCARHTAVEALGRLGDADAAVGAVMDMADIAADPHVVARGIIELVDGTPMQTVIARLSATPGRAEHPGRRLDADGDAIRRDGWRRST